jgi:pimeloyl-ACP methyl ester carboxylesterase
MADRRADFSFSTSNQTAVEGLVRVGGVDLFVRTVGTTTRSPAVLVAVHGRPGLSHESLRSLETLASANLAVVNYDQRGVGRSTGEVDPVRAFEESVEDLDAVRAALGSDRIHVVGHFCGGLLAALYAARYPARAASLTLVDSIPPTAPELALALRRKDARLAEYQRRGLVPGDLPTFEDDPTGRLLSEWPIYFVDPRHPGAWTLGGARFRPETAFNVCSSLRSYDFRTELASISTPTLHVATAVPYGYDMSDGMAAVMNLAPSRRVLLTTAGHLPFVENPGPLLAQLAEFIAAHRAR